MSFEKLYTIKEKYKELIAYICNIGTKAEITFDNQIEMIIKISDYFKNELIVIHLFQPIDRERAYNYHRLRISWRIPPQLYLSHNHWFDEDMDQREIFDLLLLDIFEYKFNTINEETIDSSNTLIYLLLKDWITNKKALNSDNKERL